MPSDKMEVLIVDDEPRQRRGLAAMVRSLRPAYKVGEAKNGKEALEYARGRQLDIVFTDIQMPIMNGLDFAAELGKSCPKEPKIVFVSVYHEFDYARKAIRLGAKDYLVKPVSSESLDGVLQELENQLIQESSVIAETRQLSEELAHTKPIYLEHLLFKWMTGELQAAEKKEIEQHFDIRGHGTVLILESHCTQASEDSHEWRSILKRAAAQALGKWAMAYMISPEHERNKLYTIIQWKPGVQSAEGLKQLQLALAALEKVHDKSIGAGIGHETFDLEKDMKSCYESAATALEYLYYFRDGRWVSAEQLRKERDSFPSGRSVGVKDNGRLEQAVTGGNVELSIQECMAILDKLAAAKPSPFRMKCNAIQLLLSCLKQAEPVMDDRNYAALALQIDEQLLRTDSLLATKATAAGLLGDIVNQMKKDKGSRSELIMQKCREYIEDNLHEDLGLEVVAQHFFYNASYFSILFKNHFGISFTDFLVKQRMQRARSLLLESDKRVGDIAKLVGYKDIKYFNKVFKKTFLYSPEEFRRMFATT
ncbi:response regulator transcription factor [Paenibacillus harenae]|uniref:response regulator transcription factor n=1 Tax=Paenibacillus harenae TaxID=306543 RepID=UPI0027927656|nr:response regulator [Paenibacillus harenae]MDQ0059975.1 two-component system response regulator YesN [Paenibacillus harenae]